MNVVVRSPSLAIVHQLSETEMGVFMMVVGDTGTGRCACTLVCGVCWGIKEREILQL